jgi:DNA topoisomerase-2
MRLIDILDAGISNYAVYKVFQRIPQVIDGLGQTQRKAVYSFLQGSIEKKRIKVLDSYTLVKKFTHYQHGDSSVYSTVNNLSSDYKNNLQLLAGFGSFGTRTLPVAAAPRYVETRLSNVAKHVFISTDDELQEKRFTEGHQIEPHSLLPVVPLAVINGYEGIAMGYSSKILPRDPIKVMDQMLRLLTKKSTTIRNIVPSQTFYTGNVIQDKNNSRKWVYYGTVSKPKISGKGNKFIISIDEVPPGVSRESFVKKLKKMKEDKLIGSYTDNCSDNTFGFLVRVPSEVYDLDEQGIIDFFGLTSSQTENFTFITDNKIIVYNSYSEYITDFMKHRGVYYIKRKALIVQKIQEKMLLLSYRVEFINRIITGSIVINKRKKQDIVDQLDKIEEIGLVDGTYDYLLNMKLYNLTSEKISELQASLEMLRRELSDINKKQPVDLWISDIEKLKQVFKSQKE